MFDISMGHHDMARLALVVALASVTDAFRPLALRSWSSSQAISVKSQTQSLQLRGRAQKPYFLMALGASTEPVCREQMYETAQASSIFVFLSRNFILNQCPLQANFRAWNEALKAQDYDKAASLYSSSDLSFLPTVSPEFIRDSHSTKRYFMDFVKRLPEGEITADNVQAFSEDAYLHTGMYTFMTGPEDNRQPVLARFSYMWRKIGGEWKIIHHHSSEVPGTKKAPEPIDLYPVAQVQRDSLPLNHQNSTHQNLDYRRISRPGTMPSRRRIMRRLPLFTRRRIYLSSRLSRRNSFATANLRRNTSSISLRSCPRAPSRLITFRITATMRTFTPECTPS